MSNREWRSNKLVSISGWIPQRYYVSFQELNRGLYKICSCLPKELIDLISQFADEHFCTFFDNLPLFVPVRAFFKQWIQFGFVQKTVIAYCLDSDDQNATHEILVEWQTIAARFDQLVLMIHVGEKYCRHEYVATIQVAKGKAWMEYFSLSFIPFYL